MVVKVDKVEVGGDGVWIGGAGDGGVSKFHLRWKRSINC